jgi:predicted dehydrogenase
MGRMTAHTVALGKARGNSLDRVRFGMVGGGEGAFIGAAHRTAAAIAGNCEFAAGALSSDPEKAKRSAAAIGLAPERSYASWREMLARERELPANARIAFVAIVTPNHLHAPIAVASLEAGFDVLTDKPAADSLEAARAMAEGAMRTQRLLGITHTYTGYPLVKEARALVAGGKLGPVKRVAVSYTQDWLAHEEHGKQAAWRTDPKQAGEAGAFGDIGTHAFNLVEYVTGERVTRIAAQLRAVVPGRKLDDDGAAMLELANGARGLLTASQVCTGDNNALTLSIWCEEAGLHWKQEEPNTLVLKRQDRPAEMLTAGINPPYLSPAAIGAARLPAGHPEGYLEAFANIYRAFANDVRAGKPSSGDPGYATIADGISAMRFVRGARLSSEAGAQWLALASVGDIQENAA